MERETIEPQVGKEMNFFDLCAACGRAIGRGCKACWKVFAKMIRLTYRYWWVALTCVILAIAAALYYTRPGNTIYNMDAIAILNGPSVQQFEQAFVPLHNYHMLPEDAEITPFIQKKIVHSFRTFRVIDCLHDGTADYVDFSGSSSATDTVKVQMKDQLCLQFCLKERDLDSLPKIEKALMDYLNANQALQQSYNTFIPNLRSEAEFNHSQALKLDSLTTFYYFHNHPGRDQLSAIREGLVFMGDWKVHLFLEEIYDHLEKMQKADYRYQLATAPVTLENHFAANPKPVNGRIKVFFLFILAAWIGSCVLAEIIDKRKEISAWLKKG